jgi:hypothetical protein
MTEIKTNEQILDAFLADYPWRWESKANALKAMQESNEQAVRIALEMAAEKATVHSEYSAHIGKWIISVIKDSIPSLHSQVLLKLKTPTK